MVRVASYLNTYKDNISTIFMNYILPEDFDFYSELKKKMKR